MTINFILGLCAGLFTANTLAQHFLHGDTWVSSAGFGLMSAGICAILCLLVR